MGFVSVRKMLSTELTSPATFPEEFEELEEGDEGVEEEEGAELATIVEPGVAVEEPAGRIASIWAAPWPLATVESELLAGP